MAGSWLPLTKLNILLILSQEKALITSEMFQLSDSEVKMKILFNVSCDDEFFDEYPKTAIVEFTRDSIQRLFKLMDTAKELDVAKICDYDNPEWLGNNPIEDNEEPQEWDGRSDCDMAHVWPDCVSWYAYIKNTDIHFGTYDSLYRDNLKKILKYLLDTDFVIHIENLNEIIKVYETPLKELPVLLGSLESEQAKYALSKRLKKNG